MDIRTRSQLIDINYSREKDKASQGVVAHLLSRLLTRRQARIALIREGYSKEQAEAILLKWGYQPTTIKNSEVA